MDIQEQILDGYLDLPMSQEILTVVGEPTHDVAIKMWSALWHNYIKNKGSVSTTYWAEKFPCPRKFNGVLQSLANKGWITVNTQPERNWSEAWINEDKLLEFDGITLESLAAMRADKKIKQYLPIFKESRHTNLVRINRKVKNTGLVREGFMLSGNTQYYFDNTMLYKYKDAIIRNTNKGMEKVREEWPNMSADEASYDKVAEAIIQKVLDYPELYTQGTSYLDSRGRAVKESLSKVFNPIGFKDARALLTIPE